MPFAPDARGDSFKKLILTFYSPKRILVSKIITFPMKRVCVFFFFSVRRAKKRKREVKTIVILSN